ncbi:MAG: DUF1501 domain-containing protein [Gammaproteobacteria bacterium]|nr:DUF1501 domain-containing protein [Gammaproteobacteria bacterium]
MAISRRDILKSIALVGGAGMSASMANLGLSSNAFANVSAKRRLNARAIVAGELDFNRPLVMPQFINVFLYGGPSELAGNMTNMQELNDIIKGKGQQSYDVVQNGRLIPSTNESYVTKNYFWGGPTNGGQGAGGTRFEDMLARQDMSLYRTINRIKDNSRAHRPSIFSNMTGIIGEDESNPGIGTTVAAILNARAKGADGIRLVNGTEISIDEALFPFVTLDADSFLFNVGDSAIPPGLKPITLNSSLDMDTGTRGIPERRARVREFAAEFAQNRRFNKYVKVEEAFGKLQELDEKLAGIRAQLNQGAILDPDAIQVEGEDPIQINYGNSAIGRQLKGAVELALANPSTFVIALGRSGLGGWDDHNDAVADGAYPERMRELTQAFEAAGKHIRAIRAQQGLDNNIFINCIGDFGRNIDLNGSRGWDHGNNMNLYTVGGNDIPGRAMGKLVGKTDLLIQSNGTRIYTKPTDDSYQVEPFSIASTVYKYFGVNNPQIINNEPPIDESGAVPNELCDVNDQNCGNTPPVVNNA